jgi:UDP-N-acetylmuramate--alanine ligase
VGTGELLVIEADESDGSIVQYHAAIGLLLNIDKDHKEVETLLDLFRQFRDNSRKFVVNHAHPLAKEFSMDAANDFTVDSRSHAGYNATQFSQSGLKISFLINDVPFELNQLGRHSMENALAAVAIASQVGVSLTK